MSLVIDPKEVAKRTQLCSLTGKIWQATRQHDGETLEENIRHNTDAAKVLVKACDHHALKDLRKLHAAARKVHNGLTLPTKWDGTRILPWGQEYDHADKMKVFVAQHKVLVAEFIADYPQVLAEAQQKLNGLYDPKFFPPIHKITSKFGLETEYMATPTDGSWDNWLIESSQAAMAELETRIAGALKRVQQRCLAENKTGERGKGRLHDTVFDDIRDLLEVGPGLDFTGTFGPVLDAMRPLGDEHAESLRDNEHGREQVAAKASSILGVMDNITAFTLT